MYVCVHTCRADNGQHNHPLWICCFDLWRPGYYQPCAHIACVVIGVCTANCSRLAAACLFASARISGVLIWPMLWDCFTYSSMYACMGLLTASWVYCWVYWAGQGVLGLYWGFTAGFLDFEDILRHQGFGFAAGSLSEAYKSGVPACANFGFWEDCCCCRA